MQFVFVFDLRTTPRREEEFRLVRSRALTTLRDMLGIATASISGSISIVLLHKSVCVHLSPTLRRNSSEIRNAMTSLELLPPVIVGAEENRTVLTTQALTCAFGLFQFQNDSAHVIYISCLTVQEQVAARLAVSSVSQTAQIFLTIIVSNTDVPVRSAVNVSPCSYLHQVPAGSSAPLAALLQEVLGQHMLSDSHKVEFLLADNVRLPLAAFPLRMSMEAPPFPEKLSAVSMISHDHVDETSLGCVWVLSLEIPRGECTALSPHTANFASMVHAVSKDQLLVAEGILQNRMSRVLIFSANGCLYSREIIPREQKRVCYPHASVLAFHGSSSFGETAVSTAISQLEISLSLNYSQLDPSSAVSTRSGVTAVTPRANSCPQVWGSSLITHK